MKTPPKSSHGLSPDTVLTTCNNSLQPHSGPMNQALLLPHFTELKHKAGRWCLWLVLCGGRKDTRG